MPTFDIIGITNYVYGGHGSLELRLNYELRSRGTSRGNTGQVGAAQSANRDRCPPIRRAGRLIIFTVHLYFANTIWGANKITYPGRLPIYVVACITLFRYVVSCIIR